MLQIDINERFRDELREQALPTRIRLAGLPMHIAIARVLLARHARDIRVEDDNSVTDNETVTVHATSLEQFGTEFLAVFLEGTAPPAKPTLLYSIPEELLVHLAQEHNIPVDEPRTSDTRDMLNRIAAKQPQTFYSLSRSAIRVMPKLVRNPDGKSLKDVAQKPIDDKE